MLETALKVLQKACGEKISNYEIRAHIGVEGHQSIPHAHLNIFTSLASCLKKGQ